MDVKNNGKKVKFQIPQQPIQNYKIDGFLPVIINITPINNLPFILGLVNEKEHEEVSRLN